MRSSLQLTAGVAALALTAGAALAADLPSRRYAPAPVPYVAVPVFTWTGFYVGVNAGGGFTDNDRRSGGSYGNFNGERVTVPGGASVAVTPAPGFGYSTHNHTQSGFTGGGQVGYNYQIGSIVVGVEGDIQYTDFGRRNSTYGNNGVFTANPTANATGLGIAGPVAGSSGNVAFFNGGFDGNRRSDYYGTVRGRLGYAFDRVLVYATGGVAFFDNSSRDSAYGFGNGAGVTGPFFTSAAAAVAGGTVTPGLYGRRRDNDVGYVVGGGVEYAFTDQIIGRVEGFYVERDTGRRNSFANQVVGVTNTGAAVLANSVSRRDNDSFGVVRAGVSYKFNTF